MGGVHFNIPIGNSSPKVELYVVHSFQFLAVLLGNPSMMHHHLYTIYHENVVCVDNSLLPYLSLVTHPSSAAYHIVPGDPTTAVPDTTPTSFLPTVTISVLLAQVASRRVVLYPFVCFVKSRFSLTPNGLKFEGFCTIT